MTPAADQLRLVQDARFRIVDEEGVVVLLEAAEVVAVNGVGARILQLVQAQQTTREITEALVAEYSVDAAQAARDVAAFVTELRAAGVLEPAAPS